ncbi:hypothetical protein IWX90DRAFT_41196 [Phyllosticta citrichinensis]|uniref:FAD/NAD(P)-binding domain-containing protein n=1 Tax=Phyllosticta citrichinensis TaxID=1130410 RepID=A0ABR1Y8A9_9PEZI
MDSAERVDMVIVGAGFHGLAMARTYLSVYPEASLIILEAGTFIGGVWARDRLYPHLKTNSVMGYFEFSDFPMTPQIYGVPLGNHIPGDAVRRYLEDYANHFDLARRCRFNSKLEEAEDLQEEGWLLKVAVGPSDSTTKKTSIIHAARMTVCIGVTSEPKLPTFPGQENYTGNLLHSRDFGPQRHILNKEKTRSVAVFAGNKSAYDVVWACANAGIKVEWIMRESGHGACWMGPTRMTPLKVLAESLIMTRMITWMFPCIWGDADGWHGPRHFLQQTDRGRRFVKWFAKNVMQHTLEKHARFEDHDETAKLRPWYPLFWVATGRGLLNYDSNVYEFIRQGMVNVHIADVDELADREIHLSNGTVLENIDAIVCCSGWQHGPTMKFTRGGKDISAELGLPHTLSAKENELYKPMVAEADAQIKSKLPCLVDQPPAAVPPHQAQQQARDPIDPSTGTLDHAYLLHRFMAPPQRVTRNRTIAFSGATRTPITSLLAQVQALWITAFFEHRIESLEPGSGTVNGRDGSAADLPLTTPDRTPPGSPTRTTSTSGGSPSAVAFSFPSPASRKTSSYLQDLLEDEEATANTTTTAADTNLARNADDPIQAHATFETILHARYGRWRYPHGFGAVMADLFFDCLPLLDLLLRDLGLSPARKGGGWLREAISHYSVHDYAGLVDEWMAAQARRDRELWERCRGVVGGRGRGRGGEGGYAEEDGDEDEDGDGSGEQSGRIRVELSARQKTAVQRAMVGVGLAMGGLTLSLGIGVAVALM